MICAFHNKKKQKQYHHIDAQVALHPATIVILMP